MKRKLEILHTRRYNDVIIVTVGYVKTVKGEEHEVVMFEVNTNKKGFEAIKQYIK